MLSTDDIADIEGDAAALLASVGLEDVVPSMDELCFRLLGTRPEVAPDGREAGHALVHGQRRIFVTSRATVARRRWLIGHELAEYWYAQAGYRGADIERRCDALGGALACPRRPFLALVRRYGHSPSRLARACKVTTSCALLRVGETTGRPVVLLTRTPVFRGEPYAWPEGGALRAVIRDRPAGVHPVRLVDERLWGLMAA